MSAHLISLLVLIPLLGFLGSVVTPRKLERTIFYIAITTILAELGLLLFLGYQWLAVGASPVFVKAGSLYASHNYTFALSFYFDTLAAVFMGMTTAATILIFSFSRSYLHRELGFKRFYSTVLLFFIGLALIILAGNFEMLFVGWELIGISSVLLIAFYRDRYLPARNALKVFSVYRIADAALLAAALYAHHLFEKNISFNELSGPIVQHQGHIVILGALLLLVALIKSAQFPFSYWLPRAMEGPTTSSAIFYGALSIHMGLFLLFRTYPIWQGSLALRCSIAIVGLVTAIVATSITRVQSSVKTQIAYASITQIGLMFIELALGLKWLVLLHFVSNASLRTYQLLISPSTVSYLVHDQFFYFVPPVQKIKNTLLGRMHATFYVLGIKEWNMNTIISRYVWQPLKSVGRLCTFLDKPLAQGTCLGLFASAAIAATSPTLPAKTSLTLSTAAAIMSIILYVRAYTTKSAATTGWNLIMLGHLFGALFLAVASGASLRYLAMYGGGVTAAFIAGHICLWYLRAKKQPTLMREYHGAIYAFPKLGNFFYILCLLFMAFPISASFLAQDILLSAIPKEHIFQVTLFCISYLLVGVSTMRLYTKVFFGPHETSYHEKAYKSA